MLILYPASCLLPPSENQKRDFGILGLPVLILDIVLMPCCSGLEIPYYIIYNMHLESKSKICDRF